MRYFFRVEYDGTRFGGWQSQTNAPSIQSAVAKAFSIVTRSACKVTGAGRTDAGVHARAQGAHVDVAEAMDPAACEYSVNAILPHDIAVYGLRAVDPLFHARYSATLRRYCYHMTGRKKPLLYKRVWPVFYKVDWQKVRENIRFLPGKHDFVSFCSSGTSTKNTVCTVRAASLSFDCGDIVFTIAADRFIYKMVRSIVGTLVDIGRGRLASTIAEILAAKNRRLAGDTAPACGLFLDYVEYPEMED
jgi:tRNA pseudouridine38-40 synthase